MMNDEFRATQSRVLGTKLKTFIWSNIPIALDAAGWTGLTFKTLNLKPDLVLIFIAFGFTWLFYTNDRLDISPADTLNNPKRTAWYASKPYLKTFMLIMAIALLGCLSQRLMLFIPASIGIIPCLLYTKQWTIKGSTFTLKGLPGMKAILVAFLWVFLTVIFPIVATAPHLLQTAIVTNLCLMIGCFVMLQINTNDLRDIEGDAKANVKSFAVLWGDKKARLFGVVLIGLGTYFGWRLYNPMILLIFSSLLVFRTFLYKKEADIYWQTPISLQGLLAYFIL